MGCHSSVGDRKIHGNLKRIIEKPSTLAEHTPKGWKKIMEDEGRVPKPLNNGAFKGVPFEDGGGYKINFEDGGIFMYHPAEKSHHNGEYYKISTGRTGVNRYDRKGRKIEK